MEILSDFKIAKKTTMSIISQLPEMMGNGYTIANVMKGFVYNGQIDVDTIRVLYFQI